MRRRSVLVGLVVIVALAALAVVFRAPLARAIVAAAFDVVTGDRVSFEQMHLSTGVAEFDGVHVRNGADPVLDAERIAIGYRLRDLLPGGSRRFGLESVRIVRPHLWLVRRADGSLNVNLGSTGAGGSGGPSVTPLIVAVAIVDGTITVLDPTRTHQESRRLELRNLQARATIDSAARSHALVTARYASADGEVPLRLSATTDAARGFALADLQAARVPLRALVNYFINTPHARISAGVARNVDFRAYSIGPPGATAPFRLAGGADVTGGSLYVPGLTAPLADVRGRIDLFDGGIALPRLDATLLGAPLRAAGAIYDFAAPHFRLAVDGAGDLLALRNALGVAARQPLAGRTRLGAFLEGSVAAPLVFITFAGPQLRYGAFSFEGARGTLAYFDSALDVVGAHARYGPLDVAVHGSLDLGDHLVTQLVVDASGPAAKLPYLDQIVPGAPVAMTGLLSGTDNAFNVHGVIGGAGGGDQLDGTFAIDERGVGRIGPVRASRADGSQLAGAFYLNRPQSESAVWLTGSGYRIGPQIARPLPGLAQFPGIPLRGRFDAAFVGDGPPSRFTVAGSLTAHDAAAGGLRLGTLRGNFAGTLAGLQLTGVGVDAPWGRFAGRGGYQAGRLALQGTYDGSFEQLASLTGNLDAHGPVRGPVAAEIGPAGTLVQTSGATTNGARVRGVPIGRIAGTLGIEGSRLRIYSALAGIAGGSLAAAGSVAPGANVGVAARDIAAARLGATGLPLATGRLDTIGAFALDAGTTSYAGGALVAGGRFAGQTVGGDGGLTYSGTRAQFRMVDGQFGSAIGRADGAIGNLGARLRLNLGVQAVGIPLAAAATALAPQLPAMAGSADAQIQLTGSPSAPRIAGNAQIPIATVNGLAVRDVAATVDAGPGRIAVESGTATVGASTIAFGGHADSSGTAVRARSDRLDLRDFDNFFDPGDLLTGSGRLALDATIGGQGLDSRFDGRLAGLRVGHYVFGETIANLGGARGHVVGSIAADGPAGALSATGSVDLPAGTAIQRLVARTSYDLNLTAGSVDVARWLVALGLNLPVSGKLDAQAIVRGRLADPALSGTASLHDGEIARVGVTSAQAHFASTLHRLTITDARVELPSLSLRGSGNLGFAPTDKLAVNAHATSADVGALVARFGHLVLPVGGALEADVRVGGTLAKPRAIGGFDIENAHLAEVKIPRALGEFGAIGRNVELRGAELQFGHGALYMAGTVPLTVAPFGVGPAAAPLAVDVTIQAIDLGDFASLLPGGSKLGGLLDGRFVLGGTAGTPSLVGSLDLKQGLVATPVELTPLTDVVAHLVFNNSELQLAYLRARAGSGTLDAHGTVDLADLIHPAADAVYSLAGTASHAQLDSPTYGRGTVDASLAFARTKGNPPSLRGTATLADAVIPFAALAAAGGSSDSVFGTSTLPPLDLGLELGIGRNVRVRSANVDIGATGKVAVAGSLADPKLSGEIKSTGGTIVYFNTVFRLLDGTVAFQPDLGAIPVIDAHAATTVLNPGATFGSKSTGVDLSLQGPVTNLSINLQSDPPYSRDQILALLVNAPAIGVAIVGKNPNGLLTPQGVATNPNPAPGVTVGEELFGVLNAQFTRNLLSPVENVVGGALGLSNLDVALGYGGNVDLTARKVLGKSVKAIYSSGFSYPYRQSVGLEVDASELTVAQLTFYETFGVNELGLSTSELLARNLSLIESATGTYGYSFSLQHRFW